MTENTALFYPARYIRTEWGTSLGICNKGYKNPTDAMRKALERADSKEDFIANHTIATLEDGEYIPIPDAISQDLKKRMMA